MTGEQQWRFYALASIDKARFEDGTDPETENDGTRSMASDFQRMSVEPPGKLHPDCFLKSTKKSLFLFKALHRMDKTTPCPRTLVR